jgi:hypothetical protein
MIAELGKLLGVEYEKSGVGHALFGKLEEFGWVVVCAAD